MNGWSYILYSKCTTLYKGHTYTQRTREVVQIFRSRAPGKILLQLIDSHSSDLLLLISGFNVTASGHAEPVVLSHTNNEAS